MQGRKCSVQSCEFSVTTPGQFRQPGISHLRQTNQSCVGDFLVTESVIPENMIGHLMNTLQHCPSCDRTSIFRKLHVNTQERTLSDRASGERL